MEKGKDRVSKLYFSDPERAREIVRLALKRMSVKAELSDLTIEDPVVSFMDTKISMEKLLDKLYKVKLSNDENRAVHSASWDLRTSRSSTLICSLGPA